MGQLAPIVSAVIRDQGAVVTSSDDGAAAQDPRSCSGDFEFTDLRTESGRGLGHPAAPVAVTEAEPVPEPEPVELQGELLTSVDRV